MKRQMQKFSCAVMLLTVAAMVGAGAAPAYAAWEPTKPVEFIVPAGAGAHRIKWRARSRASF